jgi:hypothetical protein
MKKKGKWRKMKIIDFAKVTMTCNSKGNNDM